MAGMKRLVDDIIVTRPASLRARAKSLEPTSQEALDSEAAKDRKAKQQVLIRAAEKLKNG